MSPLTANSGVIELTPNSETYNISLGIMDNSVGQGDVVVVLLLEYSGPALFENAVEIGGSNTYNKINVTIMDDSELYLSNISARVWGGGGDLVHTPPT